MANHAKEYSFDVIEYSIRANESCFDKFEFCKTLINRFKLKYLVMLILTTSNLVQHNLSSDARQTALYSKERAPAHACSVFGSQHFQINS